MRSAEQWRIDIVCSIFQLPSGKDLLATCDFANEDDKERVRSIIQQAQAEAYRKGQEDMMERIALKIDDEITLCGWETWVDGDFIRKIPIKELGDE